MGIKIDRERFALGNYQYLKYSPELFFDTAEELGIRNIELWGAAPQFYPEAMTYAELSAFGRRSTKGRCPLCEAVYRGRGRA